MASSPTSSMRPWRLTRFFTCTSTLAVSRSASSSSTRSTSRDLALAAFGWTGRHVFGQFADQPLGLAHRQAFGRNLVGCRDLHRAVQAEQGTGVAHVQVARHQHGLHRLGQVEQAQQIAGGAARAAHGLRGLPARCGRTPESGAANPEPLPAG